MSPRVSDVSSSGPIEASRAHRAAAVPSARALALPLTFTAALAALSFIPTVLHHPVLRSSFWGASLALLAWNALTFGAVRRNRRTRIDVALRPQHYIQACAHVSILAYWGWYWHQVNDAVPLIAGQLSASAQR